MRTSAPRLKKRYGQHHLRDGGLCRPLLDFLRLGRPEVDADMDTGARVLEIGPGGGVLTAELLAAGARVMACEVDLEWAFHLRRALPDPALEIFALDALSLDASRLPASTQVTGNLPFNVATPILEALLPHAAKVPRAAFMVQKEVAERLTAQPGTKAYGALTVLVRAWCDASYLGTVQPGSFRPPPKVAAAFVGLELREPVLPRDEMGSFRRLVHAAFSLRRKTLRNSLGASFGRGAEGRDKAAELLERAEIDPRRRAETLDLAEFIALSRQGRPEPGSVDP